MKAPYWIATCVDCGRLIAKDGLFRRSPMGGEERRVVVSGTGCKVYHEGPGSSHVSDPESHCHLYGCYYGDCEPLVTRSTGWHHRDCGVALHAEAPKPDERELLA